MTDATATADTAPTKPTTTKPAPITPAELLALRERWGWTQAEAAERLGTTANTWARWERGVLGIHAGWQRLLRAMMASAAVASTTAAAPDAAVVSDAAEGEPI